MGNLEIWENLKNLFSSKKYPEPTRCRMQELSCSLRGGGGDLHILFIQDVSSKLEAQYIRDKTTVAVCISRRALKGKKYLFRDIHNFSFSAKIQDGRQKWRKLKFFR